MNSLKQLFSVQVQINVFVFLSWALAGNRGLCRNSMCALNTVVHYKNSLLFVAGDNVQQIIDLEFVWTNNYVAQTLTICDQVTPGLNTVWPLRFFASSSFSFLCSSHTWGKKKNYISYPCSSHLLFFFFIFFSSFPRGFLRIFHSCLKSEHVLFSFTVKKKL